MHVCICMCIYIFVSCVHGNTHIRSNLIYISLIYITFDICARLTPLPILVHCIVHSVLYFHICNSILWQWKTWLLLSSIYLLIFICNELSPWPHWCRPCQGHPVFGYDCLLGHSKLPCSGPQLPKERKGKERPIFFFFSQVKRKRTPTILKMLESIYSVGTYYHCILFAFPLIHHLIFVGHDTFNFPISPYVSLIILDSWNLFSSRFLGKPSRNCAS